MPLKGFFRNIEPLEILSGEKVEAIHRSTLDVLEKTGLRIEDPEALKIFEKNGCHVDFESNRVRIPSYLVEHVLRLAPSSFAVKSRNEKNDIRIGGNTIYFSNMPGLRILDLETWETRPATRDENILAVKVLDALDNIHLLCAYTPYFEVEGVPPLMAIPESYAAKIRNSSKVSWEGYQDDCELFIIEMSKAAGQDVIGIGLPSAPLAYYSDACQSIIRYARAGYPINFASGCIMGGTSPASVAGTLVVSNAEVIGGIALAQFVREGTKVIVEDSALTMNMRNGHPFFGAIETCQHITAFAQVWRKYGVPTIADSGWTNSKKIDFQDAYERTATALIIALSGIHVSNFFGGVYGELAFHPVQAVLDDDIAAMIGKYIEGLEVSEETLMTDFIENIGPIPGHFLNTTHTRKNYKNFLIPKAADLSTYPEWIRDGKKDAIGYAKDRIDRLMEEHLVFPLTDEQDKNIEDILNKARLYYKDR